MAGHRAWTIDLRWEVSAAPTPEMWEAMQRAQFSMADLGEDENVNELEAAGVELTRQEACLFVPTVTSGTILAMLSGARKGSTVLMEDRCHIYWVERGHVSALAGAAPRLMRGDRFGAIPVEEIERCLSEERYGMRAPISMLCLENTHNICGGTILRPEYLAEMGSLCHENGMLVYLDGARLFNAAVALGRPIGDLCAAMDFVCIGLNKGLLAPFGALLCGTKAFIDEARENARRLGLVSIHKAGIFAAAALVALRHMVPRLAEDQARALRMAQVIADLPGLAVDLEAVQTNLVRVETLAVSARDFAAELAERGIAIHVLEPHAFKIALHAEIDDSKAEQALAALREAAERTVERAQRTIQGNLG